MALTPTLSKKRPDHPSLDYELLRAEGMRHLEQLATEIWTDFNAHDPGITLLELLSYAITDLGYRTRKLPAADLFAAGNGNAFFSPLEILPSEPVTARDYRKLLIDMDGVKNAWVEASSADIQDFAASWKEDSGPESGAVFTDKIHGLLNVILDLDDHIDPENASQTRPIVARVMRRLHAHRLLGQDFGEAPVLVGKKLLAVCLNIEVAGGYDDVETAAEALWQLEQCLRPALRFYTFQEMLEKGYGPAEIYNGPLLDHGFLDDAEVDNAQLPREFRHSDLTNAATAKPGVLTVHELKIKMPGEEAFGIKTSYTIYKEGDNRLKPVIDPAKSRIFATQNGVCREIPEAVLREPLRLKRLLAQCCAPPGGLHAPTGAPRPDLTEYRSLQYDLPGVYGVGDYDVAENTPAARKGLRKQLQAYIAFFDQMLAAYLRQLGQVRDLFSVRQDISAPTYATADLVEDGVPGMQAIADPGKTFSAESPATQADRRNRLLNHLMARFGETFSDFVLGLLRADIGPDENPFQQGFATYLQNKADFLRELPELGSERGMAYNYRGPHVWNTSNVAGIKKRVHRLLGLKGSWHTTSLLSKPPYRLDIRELRGQKGALQYQILFKVLPENLPAGAELPYSGILLKSRRYSSPKTAQEKRDALYSDIAKPGLFFQAAHPVETDQFAVFFSLTDPNAAKADLSGEPMNAEEAGQLLEYIRQLINYRPDVAKEGFHVVEHILLRPNDPADNPLLIRLGCLDEGQILEDPYSCWLTVVAPCWTKKFGSAEFQREFIQSFRREMPAELAARFIWLEMDQMRAFEEVYMAWMEAKAQCTPDECHVTKAANDLIAFLNAQACGLQCKVSCGADTSYEACEEC